MKSILVFLLAMGVSITCNKKKDSFTEAIEAADSAPKATQIQGIYHSKDTTDRLTLCISGSGRALPGYYFLMRDTEIVMKGYWEYQAPPGEGSDYTIGPPGYGLIEFDPPWGWKSYVFFDGTERQQRRIVIDTVLTWPKVEPPRPGIRKGFQKWTYFYELRR